MCGSTPEKVRGRDKQSDKWQQSRGPPRPDLAGVKVSSGRRNGLARKAPPKLLHDCVGDSALAESFPRRQVL